MAVERVPLGPDGLPDFVRYMAETVDRRTAQQGELQVIARSEEELRPGRRYQSWEDFSFWCCPPGFDGE